MGTRTRSAAFEKEIRNLFSIAQWRLDSKLASSGGHERLEPSTFEMQELLCDNCKQKTQALLGKYRKIAAASNRNFLRMVLLGAGLLGVVWIASYIIVLFHNRTPFLF